MANTNGELICYSVASCAASYPSCYRVATCVSIFPSYIVWSPCVSQLSQLYSCPSVLKIVLVL
jgi:hypothetical protein